MCHPPLILHNPQRTADMTPYIVAEQDKRFQGILDMNRNVILVSGHTHLSPTVEFDDTHNNLYINDGSICPTVQKDGSGKIQQGNVILLEICKSLWGFETSVSGGKYGRKQSFFCTRIQISNYQ